MKYKVEFREVVDLTNCANVFIDGRDYQTTRLIYKGVREGISNFLKNYYLPSLKELLTQPFLNIVEGYIKYDSPTDVTEIHKELFENRITNDICFYAITDDEVTEKHKITVKLSDDWENIFNDVKVVVNTFFPEEETINTTKESEKWTEEQIKKTVNNYLKSEAFANDCEDILSKHMIEYCKDKDMDNIEDSVTANIKEWTQSVLDSGFDYDDIDYNFSDCNTQEDIDENVYHWLCANIESYCDDIYSTIN